MFKSLIDLLFPKVCLGCHTILEFSEDIICTSCRHEIPLTRFALQEDNLSHKKFYGRIDIVHASSFLFFHKKGIVQELIYNLKYRGHQEIGTILGDWYFEDLKKVPALSTVDYIIPVPLHKKRLRRRGYNQVATFGNALAKNFKIPIENNILFRNVYTKTQSKKNIGDRNNIASAVFEVRYTTEHHNKHFLLIDDVLTTGATLESCGKALLAIPGARLSIVTMAISH
ncbi:MAG TPA: ComF family protein [Flavobacterium sp.]|jgi:ComF family protein